MEAGGSRVEGKQAPNGKKGCKDGEKGKKKKEKKEKQERLEKRSDAAKESGSMGSDLGVSAAGVDVRDGDAREETRGQSWKRKLKKPLQTQSHSQVSKSQEFIDAKDEVQHKVLMSSKLTATSALQDPYPHNPPPSWKW
ncbi:hypothetical protein PAXRUDRAFT_20708 [Paxillus rubicundulus Ve08.2h10]|uniref:Uncharacterized protein n=1 Tax=Paxillus rubicundulus Ve08.2h10 TaxID=930991 RepID=A0A0D0D162_9AGAM|nr:hypothetical protein PAXRUDRAFT_20708 [Paxillus rubicundulus Ve08.2h10]